MNRTGRDRATESETRKCGRRLFRKIMLGTIPGIETSVVAYATDIPKLTNWGTPYLFGPGSIHVAHTDDEYVELDALRQAVGIYERLALDGLAVATATTPR